MIRYPFVVSTIRGHTYVVTWEMGRCDEACQSLGKWAADPELDFTWADAAMINKYLLKASKKFELGG